MGMRKELDNELEDENEVVNELLAIESLGSQCVQVQGAGPQVKNRPRVRVLAGHAGDEVDDLRGAAGAQRLTFRAAQRINGVPAD